MISDVEYLSACQFVNDMPDSHEKAVLARLLIDYDNYTKCGTVEECQSRKEWMSYSLDDVRTKFSKIVQGLRDEVEYIKETYTPPKPKRGRPKKEASE